MRAGPGHGVAEAGRKHAHDGVESDVQAGGQRMPCLKKRERIQGKGGKGEIGRASCRERV